jgi:hypothetical protein
MTRILSRGSREPFTAHSSARIVGNNLGNESFKKPQKLPKSPANGFNASRSFSFAGSSDCEEFRSGQKLQNSHFESAAYANFATPAETNHEANTLQIKESTAVALAFVMPQFPPDKYSAACADCDQGAELLSTV